MRFVQFLFFKHALVHRFVNNCIISLRLRCLFSAAGVYLHNSVM